MNKATTILFLTLGILGGIMGIEHKIGEVLEGNCPNKSKVVKPYSIKQGEWRY
jgi:hypothetical protein